MLVAPVFFVLCLLPSCVAPSINAVSPPVHHLNLGVRVSRHDQAGQLPEGDV